MNIATDTQANKTDRTQVNLENCCENIANSVSTFNLMLTNISNKLGLSKAIYQK